MQKDYIKNLAISILIITNSLSVYVLYTRYNKVTDLENIVSQQKTNTKVVAFTQALIEKVLKSTTAVDFDTRLQLENMVRGLNDKAILDEWNSFVNSADNNQAQIRIKNLLSLLIKKVNIID